MVKPFIRDLEKHGIPSLYLYADGFDDRVQSWETVADKIGEFLTIRKILTAEAVPRKLIRESIYSHVLMAEDETMKRETKEYHYDWNLWTIWKTRPKTYDGSRKEYENAAPVRLYHYRDVLDNFVRSGRYRHFVF
jgi:hypothetical protein